MYYFKRNLIAKSKSLRFGKTEKAFSSIQNCKIWRTFGFINGEFTRGSSTENFDVLNPANGELLAQCPRMGVEDATKAAECANEAWKVWKNTSGKERSKIIQKMVHLMTVHQDDLATILTMESGKPLAEARGELSYAQSFYELYAEEAKRIEGTILPSGVPGRRMLAIRQPVGPAALITPWNFPAAMITRKLGPALAAGCTVVIKPAEETPLSALALCAIAEEAGVPKGVINCLTVARSEVAEVGKFLCNSSLMRKVSFTGSTSVGKWLMRESASTVKRISMELGGNAAFIVFDDADIEQAVTCFMNSKFRNAGQVCIATNRVFVQESIYEEFSQRLTERVNRLNLGNGLHNESTCGPLINRNGLLKVISHVDDAVSKGATVLTGGRVHEELNKAGGTFYYPTVLSNMNKDMLPFQEETFGPVAALMSFKTEEEAIALANDTRFGLASYVCTNNIGRSWRVAEALEFGMIGINEGGISADVNPFGGIKESGIGREGGKYGLDEYLEHKYICMGGIDR